MHIFLIVCGYYHRSPPSSSTPLPKRLAVGQIGAIKPFIQVGFSLFLRRGRAMADQETSN